MMLHQVKRHIFADDTQVYNALNLRDAAVCAEQVLAMQCCLAEVRVWMVTNKLRLNDPKTERLVIRCKNNVQVKDIRLIIGEETITPKTVVRNTGEILDSHLTREPQVNSATPEMYFNIRCISKVKHHRPSTQQF